MNILKFRIKNYKSIKDSGDCYLDDKITILAGKNESGKTAIVEALEDFNANVVIREDAKPIWDEQVSPEITITISLDKKDKARLKQEFQLKKSEQKVTLDISKRYPNEYNISEDSLVNLNPDLESLSNLGKTIIGIINELSDKLQNFPIDEDSLEDPGSLLSTLKGYAIEFVADVQEDESKKIKGRFE